MDTSFKRKTVLLSLAAIISLAALSAATYGWILHGSSLFLALAETGLSWCF